MALYGSIPFMMSHKKGHSAGVFWLNAAEMWVDVEKASQHNQGVSFFFLRFKLLKLELSHRIFK
jgi:alpha-glucosidase (family GH31 glycosyl hydrolase)